MLISDWKMQKIAVIFVSSVLILSAAAAGHDALSEVLPKGASCPDTILRPSLLFYLTPFVIALLIHSKNIVPDIRLMYGN